MCFMGTLLYYMYVYVYKCVGEEATLASVGFGGTFTNVMCIHCKTLVH